MSSRIRIILEDGEIDAFIDDSPTAEAIRAALPLEATVSRWGDEIYFEIPVRMPEDTNARADVEVGTLAYWPPGSAFCLPLRYATRTRFTPGGVLLSSGPSMGNIQS